MFSDTSRFRFVWIHAAVYGVLATAVKLFIDPTRLPLPVVAGAAAFLISTVAYRARLAAGKSMTIVWGANIGAATGLLTPLVMWLLHGIFLGLAVDKLLEMLVWSVAYAIETLMQVGVYLTVGGAVVGALLHYIESNFTRPATT